MFAPNRWPSQQLQTCLWKAWSRQEIRCSKVRSWYPENSWWHQSCYGTYGKNSITQCHPFLRQNNWKSRNLVLAGNFNMTNNKELFNDLVMLGQHPKEMSRIGFEDRSGSEGLELAIWRDAPERTDWKPARAGSHPSWGRLPGQFGLASQLGVGSQPSWG